MINTFQPKLNTIQVAVIFSALFLACSNSAYAQLTLSGEVRPRSEYRHGFSSLAEEDQSTAFFTEQRTRFNLVYGSEKYKIKFVFQDVRSWGSQPQLTNNSGALTSIHEAWAQIFMNENWSTKLGRQEISYDDHRIFGNVGWAQQARSHDAWVTRYSKSKFKADIGLAYNQDGPQINTSFYSVPRSYKAFQYLWIHNDFNHVGYSFLFLNNGRQGGIPTDGKTYFSQTIGGRLTFTPGNIKGDAALYHQRGNEADGVRDISALLYSVNLKYQISDKHSIGVGYEFISGNDQTATEPTNGAFNPFYGTNHKFNGLMDYFYVGNHIGNVGLKDLQANFTSKMSDKWTATAAVHLFSSDGDIIDPNGINNERLSSNFGTELDLVSSIKVNREININFGYSQIFGTSSLEAIKGGDKDEMNNWAWFMISIKPTFLTIDNKN